VGKTKFQHFSPPHRKSILAAIGENLIIGPFLEIILPTPVDCIDRQLETGFCLQFAFLDVLRDYVRNYLNIICKSAIERVLTEVGFQVFQNTAQRL